MTIHTPPLQMTTAGMRRAARLFENFEADLDLHHAVAEAVSQLPQPVAAASSGFPHRGEAGGFTHTAAQPSLEDAVAQHMHTASLTLLQQMQHGLYMHQALAAQHRAQRAAAASPTGTVSTGTRHHATADTVVIDVQARETVAPPPPANNPTA